MKLHENLHARYGVAEQLWEKILDAHPPDLSVKTIERIRDIFNVLYSMGVNDGLMSIHQVQPSGDVIQAEGKVAMAHVLTLLQSSLGPPNKAERAMMDKLLAHS